MEPLELTIDASTHAACGILAARTGEASGSVRATGLVPPRRIPQRRKAQLRCHRFQTWV